MRNLAGQAKRLEQVKSLMRRQRNIARRAVLVDLMPATDKPKAEQENKDPEAKEEKVLDMYPCVRW